MMQVVLDWKHLNTLSKTVTDEVSNFSFEDAMAFVGSVGVEELELV